MNSLAQFFFFVAFMLFVQAKALAYQALTLPSASGIPLKAWLLHPDGLPAEQPRPVVIALHGCGGLYATQGSQRGQLNARHDGMARLLVAQGYSVLLPDSFSARGESSICEQKMKDRKVRTSDRRDDVSGALDWLAQQHWSNAQKVALLGWSHGASTALASINALDPMVSARELQPSLTIAFYPGCSGLLRSGFKPLTPLLMLLGELDDWTPAGPCVELAKRVHARVEVYPNSHHDFDNPVGSVRLRTEVPNGEHPGMGVHAGRNPITGPQAWKTVVDTLASQWGLLITPRNSTAQ